MWVHNKRLWCFLLLLFIGCGEGMRGSGSTEGEEGDAPVIDRRLLVQTTTVERGDVANYLETTGVLESLSQASIIPETTGRVQEILVSEGDWVEADQTLALIGNPSIAANVDRARVERNSAQRAAANAQNLFAQGVISQVELDQALDAKRTADASWREATASKGFTVVKAPISGEIVTVNIHVGEQAGAVQAFQIVDTRNLRVVTDAPEMDLNRLRVNQDVTLSSAYEIRDPETGRPQTAIETQGRVQNVGNVIDPIKGTARVIIAVTEEAQGLRVGQFLRIRIKIDEHQDVVRIPRMAMIWDGFESIAWQMVEAPDEVILDTMRVAKGTKDDGQEADEPDLSAWDGVPRRMAKKVRVELGYQDDAWVEILSGVSEGDEVILEGNTNLREKSLLRLPEDPDLKGLDEEESGDEEAGEDEEPEE